jgi:hypothetical protein
MDSPPPRGYSSHRNVLPTKRLVRHLGPETVTSDSLSELVSTVFHLEGCFVSHRSSDWSPCWSRWENSQSESKEMCKSSGDVQRWREMRVPRLLTILNDSRVLWRPIDSVDRGLKCWHADSVKSLGDSRQYLCGTVRHGYQINTRSCWPDLVQRLQHTVILLCSCADSRWLWRSRSRDVCNLAQLRFYYHQSHLHAVQM